jgi:hypothetical protein
LIFDQTTLCNYEKSLSFLEVWRTQIDLDERGRTDKLDRAMINVIYHKLSDNETILSEIYFNLSKEFDKPEEYCKMAILHAG